MREGGDQSNDAVPDMQEKERERQGETREARVHTIKSVVMVGGVVV
jgi:ribosomal protein L4